ncbi:hypothetical protein ACTFIU_008254 [Dictyostelium citrinum]
MVLKHYKDRTNQARIEVEEKLNAKEFWDQIWEVVKENQIPPHFIFNVDEKAKTISKLSNGTMSKCNWGSLRHSFFKFQTCFKLNKLYGKLYLNNSGYIDYELKKRMVIDFF